jgi:hypothetical protein
LCQERLLGFFGKLNSRQITELGWKPRSLMLTFGGRIAGFRLALLWPLFPLWAAVR